MLKKPPHDIVALQLIIHVLPSCRCEILSHCSHFLLVFNSSINILIYCWKDAKFRALLLDSLGLCKESRSLVADIHLVEMPHTTAG
jgi:hypothetical protein